jgi:hypothetical protein
MPRTFALILVLMLTLSLTACGPGRDKSRRPSNDWSKGVQLAHQIVGAANMLAEADGEAIHLVWPANLGSRVRIRYMQLDSETNPVVDEYLEMETAWPRAPLLAQGSDDRLHLFWANRLGGEFVWELWHGFIDTLSGELGEMQQLSLAGTNVDAFSTISDGAGGAYVFWDSRDVQAINGLHIDANGEVTQGPMRITDNAVSPSGTLDRSGNLHLAWLSSELQVTYAVFEGGDLEAVQGTPISSIVLGIGDSMIGPKVGLSDGWTYILWSTSSISGLEPGTAKGWYAAFPMNEPETMNPEQVWLVPFEDQEYREYQGAYNLTELADLAVAPYGSDYVENLDPISGHPSTLAVATVMKQDYRLDTFLQIAIMLFEHGELIGYQVATKTDSISQEPVITIDAADNLYIAWREGPSGNRIFLATTAPVGRENLNSIDGNEILRSLISGGVESFAGFGFFPFAFFWLVPGLLILGLVEVFGKETEFNKPLPLAALVVSMLFYEIMKIIIVPTIFSYIPFSAWIGIPSSLETVLRVGVPLATLGIGIFIAWWISWRRDNRAALIFFFVAAGIDALLTLMIYGVNFLGAF